MIETCFDKKEINKRAKRKLCENIGQEIINLIEDESFLNQPIEMEVKVDELTRIVTTSIECLIISKDEMREYLPLKQKYLEDNF